MAGIAIGTVGAVVATRALTPLFYGVQPGDSVTLVIVAVALLFVAVLSTLRPGRPVGGLDSLRLASAAAVRRETVDDSSDPRLGTPVYWVGARDPAEQCTDVYYLLMGRPPAE